MLVTILSCWRRLVNEILSVNESYQDRKAGTGARLESLGRAVTYIEESAL